MPLQKATSRLTSSQAGESLSVEPLMTDRRCSRPCPALFASQDVHTCTPDERLLLIEPSRHQPFTRRV